MFLVARVLNGIGAGMIIANTPVYMSEIAPAHTRGILVSCQGVAVTLAYIVSSLIAFGFHFVDHPFQWRLQFIVLTSLSLLLVVAMYFIPESPRWLMVSIISVGKEYHHVSDDRRRIMEGLMKPGECYRGCTAPRKTLMHVSHERNMFKSRHRSKRNRYAPSLRKAWPRVNVDSLYHLGTGTS